MDVPDQDIRQRNLAALAASQPRVARLLAEHPEPDQPVNAEDSSALAIPEDAECVALGGIGNPQSFAAIVGAPTRPKFLFVFERHTAHALNILSAVDVAQAIDEGGLYFFLGDGAPKEFEAFLFENDTMPQPQYLLVQNQAEEGFYNHAVNLVAALMLQRRRYAIQAMAEEDLNYYVGFAQNRAAPVAEGSEPAKFLVFDPAGGFGGRQCDELARALGRLGHQTRLVSFRRPRVPTQFSVLKDITRLKPDCFVAMTSCRLGLGVWIPAGMPALFWLHRPVAELWDSSQAADRRMPYTDMIVPAFEDWIPELGARGLDTENMFSLGPAIDPDRYPHVEQELRPHVVFLGNTIMPEAAQSTGEGDIMYQVVRILQEQGLPYRHGGARSIVEHAFQDIDLSFGSEQVADGFVPIVECNLAPYLQKIAVVSAIAKEHPVKACGSGWAAIPGMSKHSAGGPEFPDQVVSACAGQIVVCADPGGLPNREMLEAAACGGAIVAGPGEPAPDCPLKPGEHFLHFAEKEELLGAIQRLRSDSQLRQELASNARRTVAESFHIDDAAKRLLKTYSMKLAQIAKRP